MIKELMNLAHKLDQSWVKDELIPLLVVAYGEQEQGHWEEAVQRAAETIHELTIYEDFKSTIERFRLLLVNEAILSRAEIADFGSLRAKTDICIGVFVRHAIIHGPYKLHSLGNVPDPDQPRDDVTEENQDSYIFGGKLCMRRGEQGRKKRKPDRHQDHRRHKIEHHGEHQQTVPGIATIRQWQLERPYSSQDHIQGKYEYREQPRKTAQNVEATLTSDQSDPVYGNPSRDVEVQQPLFSGVQTPHRPDTYINPRAPRHSAAMRDSVPRRKKRFEQNSFDKNTYRGHIYHSPQPGQDAMLSSRDHDAPPTYRYGQPPSSQHDVARSNQHSLPQSHRYEMTRSDQYNHMVPHNKNVGPPSQEHSMAPHSQSSVGALDPYGNQAVLHSGQSYRPNGPFAVVHAHMHRHLGNSPQVDAPAFSPGDGVQDLRDGARESLSDTNGDGF